MRKYTTRIDSENAYHIIRSTGQGRPSQPLEGQLHGSTKVGKLDRAITAHKNVVHFDIPVDSFNGM